MSAGCYELQDLSCLSNITSSPGLLSYRSCSDHCHSLNHEAYVLNSVYCACTDTLDTIDAVEASACSEPCRDWEEDLCGSDFATFAMGPSDYAGPGPQGIVMPAVGANGQGDVPRWVVPTVAALSALSFLLILVGLLFCLGAFSAIKRRWFSGPHSGDTFNQQNNLPPFDFEKEKQSNGLPWQPSRTASSSTKPYAQMTWDSQLQRELDTITKNMTHSRSAELRNQSHDFPTRPHSMYVTHSASWIRKPPPPISSNDHSSPKPAPSVSAPDTVSSATGSQNLSRSVSVPSNNRSISLRNASGEEADDEDVTQRPVPRRAATSDGPVLRLVNP